MFSSIGYFRGIYCPFYVNGLCERPNCHYRHSRVEEKHVNKQDNSPAYSPSIRQFSTGILQSGKKDASTINSKIVKSGEPSSLVEVSNVTSNEQVTVATNSSIPSFSETLQFLPEPKESPVKLGSLPKISGLPKPRNRNSGSSDLPSYIPTPKNVESVTIKAIPSYNPTPKQQEKSFKKRTRHTAEYDPVKNFSVHEKARSDILSDQEDLDGYVSMTKSGNFSSKDETVEAVPTDNDNCLLENKKTNAVDDDDLTDSDEDVSENYVPNHEITLPAYAELLTPSSFFTNKLNSVEKRLSTELRLSTESQTASSTAKCNENPINNSTSSNVLHNNSKHKHHSHRSSNSHSSSKSTSTKDANGSQSSSTPHNKSSTKSSLLSHDKSHSSSRSKSKQRSKDSSELLNSLKKQSDNETSSIENKLAKVTKHSHVKNSHKDIENGDVLKERLEKSSSNSHKIDKSDKTLLKSNVKEDKIVLKNKDNSQKHKQALTDTDNSQKHKQALTDTDNSQKHKQALTDKDHRDKHKSVQNSIKEPASTDILRKSLSNSQGKHLDKSSCNTNSVQSGSSAITSHSSKNGKHRHSLSSTSSLTKSDSLKTNKHSSSHKSSSSHGLVNGHSHNKKENHGDSSSVSTNQKQSVSNNNKSCNVSEVPIKVEHNGSTSSGQHDRRSSSDSGHHGHHKHTGLDPLNKTNIKQERRDSTDKTTSSNKDTKRRSSGDQSPQIRRASSEKHRNSKTKKERKSSVESGKLVVERRISDITSNLFGEDSAGSDSDVQIVEPPPQPPPLVVELSESESEVDSHSENEDSASFPLDMEMSDSDTFDECLRIFQETERQLAARSIKTEPGTTPETAKIKEAPKITEASESFLMSLGKKRLAHKSTGQVTQKVRKQVAVNHRPSPAEVMYNRIVEMQQRALLRAAKREGREAELPTKLSDSCMSTTRKLPGKIPTEQEIQTLSEAASTLLSSQKKREAHSSNTKTPTKTTTTNTINALWSPNSFYHKNKAGSTSSKDYITISSSVSKTEKRKAHEPTQVNLNRPVIPVEFGSKVPTNTRQRYLNLIIDEYLKFSPEETAFIKGLEEEQTVYNRASNKNIYLRVAVNAIARLRMEASESQPSSSKKPCTGVYSLSSMAASSSSLPVQSHEATLGGSLAAKTSFTLNRSSGNATRNSQQKLSGKDLYELLTKYILTEEQLRQNGFPRPSEDGSNKAQFYKEDEKDKMLKSNERTCKRCGKMFFVDKFGETITTESCVYHYTRPYKKRVNGFIDSRYDCCNERIGSKGCQIAKVHVHEKNKTDCLTGYMKTLPAPASSAQNYSVYSLDCEMVYTKIGLELARVTVIGDDCEVKYESLVKTDADIIDYNTRFSGITEKDMKGITTTLRGVQAVLLSMFSDKTILIGHSLESDLQALKLIHSTVVDTSLAFPHRLGLPYKRALKSLMVDHLQKIIQSDDGGHDSKEDAVACMQLMLYKVKADRRRF